MEFNDLLFYCSSTSLELLSRITPKFCGTLSSALIGNIVTGSIANKATALQIALGVVVREKSIIELLHKFGITSYTEVLRFRCSKAHAASKSQEHLGMEQNSGFVQVVADNFDADISSPNGL